MDYCGVQIEELEVLQSIYPKELRIISSVYPNISFQCSISNSDYSYEALLTLELPTTYPDDSLIFVLDYGQLEVSPNKRNYISNKLFEISRGTLGVPKAYDIISFLKDELDRISDENRKSDVQKEEVKEELEAKKFEGTSVTRETFLKWKEIFDRDSSILNKKRIEEKEAAVDRKLTGREQFRGNIALDILETDLLQLDAMSISEELFTEDLSCSESDDSD